MLNRKFTTTNQVVSSYPYSEIADGTGITAYLGCRAAIDNTPANDELFLTTSTMASNYQSYTSIVTDVYIDFDVQFLAPKIISGKTYISLPLAVSANPASGTVGHDPHIKIVHYDGTTETELVADTTLTNISRTIGTGTSYFDIVGKFTIPKTHFKQDEILRIKYKGVLTGVQPGGQIYHNPLGTSSVFTNSGGIMKVLVPFILDLI